MIDSCSMVDRGEVIEIRQAYAEGYSQRAIAKAFDVGKTTIHDIVTGKTWKGIPTWIPYITPAWKDEGYRLIGRLAAEWE